MRQLPSGVFLGQTNESRTISGAVIARSSYSPRTCIRAHAHASDLIFVVLEGAFTESSGGVSRTLEAPDIGFLPAGEAHANQWHRDPGACLQIEVLPELMARIRDFGGEFRRPVDLRKTRQFGLGARLYQEFRCGDDLSTLSIEGLTLEIIAEVGRTATPAGESRPPSWLNKVRDFIHAHLASAPQLDAVAREVGVHPSHLARVVRKHWGCTLGEYARRLRIEAACRALVAGQRSLAEIALEFGFADQSHFTRAFRGVVGLTPSEFRRAARNSHSSE